MKKPTIKSLKEKAESMEITEAYKWLSSLPEEYGESVKKLADKYYKRMELMKKEEERLLAMSSLESEAYGNGYFYAASYKFTSNPFPHFFRKIAHIVYIKLSRIQPLMNLFCSVCRIPQCGKSLFKLFECHIQQVLFIFHYFSKLHHVDFVKS
jgi:hypothetical protein